MRGVGGQNQPGNKYSVSQQLQKHQARRVKRNLCHVCLLMFFPLKKERCPLFFSLSLSLNLPHSCNFFPLLDHQIFHYPFTPPGPGQPVDPGLLGVFRSCTH